MLKLHTRLDRTVEQQRKIMKDETVGLFGGCLMVIIIVLASIIFSGAMIAFFIWVVVTILKIMGVL